MMSKRRLNVPVVLAHVTTEKVLARDLLPGDLFSMAGPEYWKDALDRNGVGEKVYIRTNRNAGLASDPLTEVYRLRIHTQPNPEAERD